MPIAPQLKKTFRSRNGVNRCATRVEGSSSQAALYGSRPYFFIAASIRSTGMA